MSKQYRYKQLAQLVAASALAGVCGSAFASGFQIQEQNVTNLGTAYAGTASLAEDATTGFYNSAGLARLGEEQIAVSAVYIVPRFKIDATSALTTGGTNFRNLGPASAKSDGNILVPGLHYFRRLDDCWTFGLNLVTPFGLKTVYDSDSVTRYIATRADMRTYDIAPSLAYCFGNGFSVGAGVDIVYVQTRLDAAVGIGNASTDGFLVNTFSKWAFGGHVGALWQISDCTRIGANYRSQLKVKGRGTSDRFASAPLGRDVVPFSQSVNSTFTLPDTAVISGYHQFDDCWAIMADAQWTHWKKFQNATLVFGDGGTLRTNLNLKDTWRLALGTSYKFDDCWLWRIGAAYDESPVRDGFRTVQVPDSNRYWLAIGGRYSMNYICKGLAVDFGYAHLFFKRADVAQLAPRATTPTGQGLQSITGRYKNRANMLGIQLTWDLV